MGALVTIFKTLPAEAEPLVLELTGRIEKLRALDDDESRLVEEAIRREKRRTWQDKGTFRHIWTAKEDLRIKTAGHSEAKLKAIAADIGVTLDAIRGRRKRLLKMTTCNPVKKRLGE